LGTLAGGLGCFPLDDESSHPPSHARHPLRGIRRLVRVGKRQAPSPIQRATSAQPHAGAAPKCISGRTSYLRVRLAFHRSPQLIRTFCNRSRCGPPRACSARFGLATVRSPGFGSTRHDSSPLRTRCRCGSTCPWLSLPPRRLTRRLILQKARRHQITLAPTGRGRTVSGSISLPSPGCFSPFPHGTGSLSVVGGI
jgi:hypothetical protein